MNSLSQQTLCPNEHFVPTNSLSQRNLSQQIICPDERFVPTNYVSRRIMCSLGERVRLDEPLISLIISRCGGGDILSIGSRLWRPKPGVLEACRIRGPRLGVLGQDSCPEGLRGYGQMEG